MDYQETLTYLYNSAPLFQQIGKDAYKEGLENTIRLDEYFGHPHQRFRTIHVAGTNHLVDFRERIRVNGIPVSQDFVIRFVEQHRAFFEPLHPSFFELTTAMAFLYFAEQKVDVAVIEVGLGGRLDCTNIIHPDLCLITNISFDHVQFLGNTLEKIATEKAGIIKPHVPVVIGETTPETYPVFKEKADSEHAPIVFAEEEQLLKQTSRNADGTYLYQTADYKDLTGELGGLCQQKNTNTLLSAIRQLIKAGYPIGETNVREGFAHVCELTGLMGRWQKLSDRPTLVCDTGHNTGGMQYIAEQLSLQTYRTLRIVIGMVNDKDISGVLSMLPKEACYYFTQASVKRALPAEKVKEAAAGFGLKGNIYPNVGAAVEAARKDAAAEDFIFVGGSSFIVADLLSLNN